MQIIHPGVFINSGIETVYGPSNIINPLYNITMKELTKDDIIKIENEYEKVALKAKKVVLMELNYIVHI